MGHPSIYCCLMWLATYLSTSESCQSYFDVPGFKLQGHVLKSFVTDRHKPAKCFWTCLADWRCRSVNYSFKDRRCDLNRFNNEDRPETFIAADMSMYMDGQKTEWKRVTRAMVSKASIRYGRFTYNDVNGGLEIRAKVPDGMVRRSPHQLVVSIAGSWTHVMYTQTFYGSVSCPVIFGMDWGGGLDGLHYFDRNFDDVWNEQYMTKDGTGHKCDIYCGKAICNSFWTKNTDKVRKATVRLRRQNMEEAGIMTIANGATAARYEITDIYVM